MLLKNFIIINVQGLLSDISFPLGCWVAQGRQGRGVRTPPPGVMALLSAFCFPFMILETYPIITAGASKIISEADIVIVDAPRRVLHQ